MLCRAVLGLESPSYGEGDVEADVQASRARQCPGVRHGCRRSTLRPLRFLRVFASSRETNNLLRAAAGTGQGGVDPSPPSPLPFQGRGVLLRFPEHKKRKILPSPP